MNWLINWLDSKIKFSKEKEEMIDTTKTMSDREVRELKERVRAMSSEELCIVANTIPVELCLARIHDEINNAKAMEESIRNLTERLQK